MAQDKRLIDANALKAEFTGNFHEMWHYTGIRAMIDVQPPVDAMEVVHGRWEQTVEPLGWGDVLCGECSNCHETFVVDEEESFDDFAMWKYCPNCGAKMNGGNEDENP